MVDIENLLRRYHNGTLSEKEKVYVDNWLKETENPNAVWQYLNDQEKQHFVNNLHRDILNKINSRKAKVFPLYRQSIKWRYIGAAVAIFLILAISGLVRYGIKTKLKEEDFVVVDVGPGKKQQVQLTDGSVVWLNEGSTLRYPKTFAGDLREVWLRGEGYFDVHHNPSSSFVVHTGKIYTTVLGTAFNIKKEAMASDFFITVTRGKVSVATEGRKMLDYVEKGESLILAKAQVSKVKQNADESIAWLPQDLEFDDMTLAEVVKFLEQRYSKHIELENPKLANCRFSGSAPALESLDDVLKVICAFNHAKYRYQNNSIIIIDGEGCN